jgi:predicted permease
MLIQDLRHGVRILARSPGATAVTVFVLALGIGVNTAVFTAYKAMVGRSLDARNPAELVNVALVRESGTSDPSFSYPDYKAYRDSLRTVSGLLAFRPGRFILSNTGGLAGKVWKPENTGLLPADGSNQEFVHSFVVSENYFEVLQIAASRGRTFESGHPSAVLISENYWLGRFAGDPSIVGKTVHLNGVPVTIAGVTPLDFVGTGMGAPAFWVPIGLEPVLNNEPQWLEQREQRRYRMVGRLAPGVSMEQANAEIALLTAQLRALHDPKSDAARSSRVLVWPGSPFPLPIRHYGGLNLTIALIMSAAAMVLVVAAANAGGLQLARVRSREAELRTRMWLGASRSRVIRQLLTESTLPCLLAGILAVFLSWGMLKGGEIWAADLLPVGYRALVFDVAPDPVIFGYVFAVSLIAGILSGIVPALLHSGGNGSSSRTSTASVSGRRLQDLLVALQVALSLVLLATGSMFVRSAARVMDVDPGFDFARLVQVDVQLPSRGGSQVAALSDQLRDRFLALPGVTSVSRRRAASGGGASTTVAPVAGARTEARLSYVEPNYFATLGMRLVAGSNGSGGESPVVLSESLARHIWPGGESPLGRELRIRIAGEDRTFQVAGIVRDIQTGELDLRSSREAYLAFRAPDAAASTAVTFLIHTNGIPAEVMRAIDGSIAQVDRDGGIVATYKPLEEMLRQSPRFVVSAMAAGVAFLIGSFGLILALMGIYGTVSYIVALRTREVGIRLAVGAQSRDILGLILREGTRPVWLGLVAGTAIASGLVYVLRGIFFGINGADSVVVFAGVAGVFLGIGLCASYPPARRAMRVDPVEALRHDG